MAEPEMGVRAQRAALVVVAFAILIGVIVLIPRGGDAVDTPHASPPLADPIASTGAQVGGIVHGWPGTTAAPAGLYSWDMVTDKWMHHATRGTVGVSLLFAAGRGQPPAGGTPILVGGLPGFYYEEPDSPDGLSRIWRVLVHGILVSIHLTAVPGTPPSFVDEAHRVVESIVVVPRAEGDDDLVFTLPYGWDSG
jgi:hypothetical protein